MADKRIQYYYQYEFYANDKDVDLECVRSFTLMYDRLFMYFDKYNRNHNDVSMDHVLVKALMQHRNNKFVSDILETIQANQFEIIKQDINKDLLILGCAGSGKTMILFHRLYYIRFNYPDFLIENMILLAPTSLLASQTQGLVRQLRLDSIKQYTIPDFVYSIYKKYTLQFEDSFEDVDLSKVDTYELFIKERLLKIKNEVDKKKNSQSYINQMGKKIEQDIELIEQYIVSKQENKNDKIQYVYNLYDQANTLSEKYSKENIELVIKGLETKIRSLSIVQEIIEYIDFLKPYRIFQTIDDNVSVFSNMKEDEAKLNACRRYIAPISKVFRSQKIHDLKAKKFVNPHDLFTYVLRQTNYSRETVNKTMDKIMRMKQSRIDEIYDYLLQKKDEISLYEQYILILKEIIQTNRLRNHSFYHNHILFGSDIEDYKELQGFFEFYQALNFNEIKTQVKDSFGVDSPFELMELYIHADNCRLRFQLFKKGNEDEYLIDFIYHFINPNYSIYDYKMVIGYDELFAITYLLSFVSQPVTMTKKLILVDEFQDLSIAEIELLKSAYPNSIFNYYGDLSQCMNPKGIHNEIECKMVLSDITTYRLNANYRNSYEITSYVNQTLDLDFSMDPIGVNGYVQTIEDDPQVIQNEVLNQIKVDDRAAFIVKDKKDISEEFRNALGIVDISYKKINDVPRGRLILYSIQEAKGLEFEIVLVDDRKMTKNEKYVAYTRALDRLYIMNKIS